MSKCYDNPEYDDLESDIQNVFNEYKHKGRVLSEQEVMDNRSSAYDFIDVDKQETTLEEHNYLQGFINQFEEEGEHQELSNDDWTVSQFLKWVKLNNFVIIKMKTKNSYPSSEFEQKDKCPSCGSFCNIHTDLSDNDECNDCRTIQK